MTAPGLLAAQAKMRDAGVDQTAIDVFSHYFGELEAGATGLILEDTIEPLTDPPLLADVAIDEAAANEAFARTAIIRLNGGLGTSMGMDRAKSLLPVRDGRSFLDLIVEQVRHARQATGAPLPLILMNSFRTQEDSLNALSFHPDVAVDGLPVDFLQNQEPKLLVDGLMPVDWPADPTLEWCPPGHGDIYTALLGSGILKALLDAGFKYAATGNSDNLGSVPSPTIAGWFAASGAPYAAELCPRTAADRKGGHLAVRKSDGRLILRDTAQTAPEEMHYFTDEFHHPYFHTNNLWFDLEKLYAALTERGAVLGLPLIRNVKNVDPTDGSSPEVFQIETAMGAAIEVFEGATSIVVGRDRFLPVKTTNDLLLLRSDAYDLGEDGGLRLAVDKAPLVDLDSRFYKTMAKFEARFPHGAPSLRGATSLTVKGDWTFGAGVVCRGDVTLEDTGSAEVIPDGTVLEG
ncbi:UTP--glucose-1-phosphate uridylyltransferase [Demequina sp. SYSU T00039]|uniref:UTP--glucose-1-phosphate uridylyltransferase n=1 Tax=Demequina lignilytica TaxID=3051663 RepID=A0AAW7M2G1_9MICO|nr:MULTISPECIES: UTP--glucose-1-phosphate uridylyltransferase [unclassified Demequina]MDN4477905.1 UTP--glucose-1-phosphate uridylyltransferase [Demequina sp. SYSU T00039-1]MDN4487814.1 UTP--glucose-1-phosphate uridylyltransferase [Demequina sp. SYSU T00039]